MTENHIEVLKKVSLIFSREFFDFIKPHGQKSAGEVAASAQAHFTAAKHPVFDINVEGDTPTQITPDDVVRARKIQMGVLVHDRYSLIFHWLTSFLPFINRHWTIMHGSQLDVFKEWVVANKITTYFQDDPTQSVDIAQVEKIFTSMRSVIVQENL